MLDHTSQCAQSRKLGSLHNSHVPSTTHTSFFVPKLLPSNDMQMQLQMAQNRISSLELEVDDDGESRQSPTEMAARRTEVIP